MKKNSDNPSINVHEVEAILIAFQAWAPKWEKQQLRVFTDSTTAFSRLREWKLKRPANVSFLELWILATEWDVVIEPQWIKCKRYILADAFSRFDKDRLIDLYPYW